MRVWAFSGLAGLAAAVLSVVTFGEEPWWVFYCQALGTAVVARYILSGVNHG